MTEAQPGPRPTTTARGRSTRDRIIAAAADLMFRQGVARTSIPEVLAEAKVSASQVYHYFGDKQGLVRAVIAHQIESSLEHQRPVLDQLDTFEALEAWRDGAVRLQVSRNCEGGCEIGSLAYELCDTDPLARADLEAAFDRWEAPIRRGLATMKSRGTLRREADTDQLATALLAAIQGGLLLTQIRRDITPFTAAVDSMIAHIRSFATT